VLAESSASGAVVAAGAADPFADGHAASSRSLPAVRSHTSARWAPVASTSIRAIRGRTSSVEWVPAICSENSDSTSYGVARLP
jgi:hypothetical protein